MHASAQSISPNKTSAKGAPPRNAELVADGTVVPDEKEGPYDLASYHSNITGKHRGYKAGAGFDEWYAENKETMWPSTRAGRPRP